MSAKKIIGLTGLVLLTTALPAYLIWQINQFYVIARAENAILGGTHAWIFDKMTYQSFNTVLTRFNTEVINKMDFTPFSNSDFMKTLTEKMPDLAGNSDFIKAISDGKLNEFLKTLNHNDQYQLFDIYNKFCKNLPNQTDQMKKFAESFKALEKLHDSGIKSNYLPLCNWLLIGLAFALLSSGFLLTTLPTIFNSLSQGKIEFISYDQNCNNILEFISCNKNCNNILKSLFN
jgi:hypothetical protein